MSVDVVHAIPVSWEKLAKFVGNALYTNEEWAWETHAKGNYVIIVEGLIGFVAYGEGI